MMVESDTAPLSLIMAQIGPDMFLFSLTKLVSRDITRQELDFLSPSGELNY